MLEVDIFDKDILYEIRYGRKDESGWCTRNFYWNQNRAITRYNELKNDWKVELIKYEAVKSFMHKNFYGEFDNLRDGQYPNKFLGDSAESESVCSKSNNEISW